MQKNLTVLHILLQDIQVCIDLHYIEKILPLPLLEIVPSSPVYFAGLMNLKNQCIPVIDLAICVGLERDQIYSLNVPILLCSDGTHKMGLIVDKVLGLGNINEEEIEIHAEFAHHKAPFLGAVTLETGVSLVLNIRSLFMLKLAQEINPFHIHHEQKKHG